MPNCERGYRIEISTFFKTQKYSWGDIKEINISARQIMKYLYVTSRAEAITINMHDNSVVHIWSDYYSNKADLRLILDRANTIIKDDINKMELLNFCLKEPILPPEFVDDSEALEFNGNHVFTLNGFVIYSWLLLLGFILYYSPRLYYNFIVAAVFLALICVASRQFFYFKITPQYLVVRHSMWFWRKDVFSLSDIKEIVIESTYRQNASTLRVVTVNLHDKCYPAASLSGKTWLALVECLQSNNTKVTNEVY